MDARQVEVDQVAAAVDERLHISDAVKAPVLARHFEGMQLAAAPAAVDKVVDLFYVPHVKMGHIQRQ